MYSLIINPILPQPDKYSYTKSCLMIVLSWQEVPALGFGLPAVRDCLNNFCPLETGVSFPWRLNALWLLRAAAAG